MVKRYEWGTSKYLFEPSMVNAPALLFGFAMGLLPLTPQVGPGPLPRPPRLV